MNSSNMNNGIILADKIKQKSRSIEEDAQELIKKIQEQDLKIANLEKENASLKSQIKPFSKE